MSHLVDYILSDGGSQATVVIRGAGFTEEKPALQVEVNDTTCHVIRSNRTEVVCQMERLPVGVYQLTLLVRPYGFALNGSTGEGVFLRVEPKLVAIEPPTASEIGRSECQTDSKGSSAFCFLLFMACFGGSVLTLPMSSPAEKDIMWLDTLRVPQSPGVSFFKSDRLSCAVQVQVYSFQQFRWVLMFHSSSSCIHLTHSSVVFELIWPNCEMAKLWLIPGPLK